MPEDQTVERIVCPPAKDPAVRALIMAAMLIGFGVWCFVEAYVFKAIPETLKDGDISDKAKYYQNMWGPFIFPAIGLIPLVWTVIFLRRTLVADEIGIGYEGREQIPWATVTAIDSADLKKKGILRLQYAQGNTPGTLVLRDWRMKNFKALAALIEKHTPVKQG